VTACALLLIDNLDNQLKHLSRCGSSKQISAAGHIFAPITELF